MKIIQRSDETYKILKYQRYYAENFIKVGVEHYEKCSYRCMYCITESQGKTRPVESSADLLMERFLGEVSGFSSDAHVFCLSVATDPYNEIEAAYGYTRRILDWLTAHDRRISMTTKSAGVLRDIDLLQRMHHDRCKVIVSLTSSCTESSRRVEPFAPLASERLDTIGRLHAAGVHVVAGISPWIPGITDIAGILERLPPGCPVFVQPLLVGSDYEEPLDNKRPYFSAQLSIGKNLTQDDINRAYIHECNTVGRQYWRKRSIEWRMPVTVGSHHNNEGYLKRLKPGMLDPETWGRDGLLSPNAPENGCAAP